MKKQNGDAKDQELMITQEELRELIKLEKVKRLTNNDLGKLENLANCSHRI